MSFVCLANFTLDRNNNVVQSSHSCGWVNLHGGQTFFQVDAVTHCFMDNMYLLVACASYEHCMCIENTSSEKYVMRH